MHSQNIPRHSLETFLDALWEFCKYLLNALSKTLRQLSRHSGNFLETHSDTGNTFGNPQWTLWMLRKHSRNSLDTVNILWKPSVNSLTLWNFLKYLLDALSEILRQLSRHSGNLLKTLLDTRNTI
jgi:hypothetical protein